jgi:hypothetical protein
MLSARNILNLETVDLPVVKSLTISHLEEFSNMDNLEKRWKEINSDDTMKLAEPRKKNGRYICSVGETSKEYTATDIRKIVGGTSMAYWGSGYTNAKEGDIIHRTYVGYDGDNSIFFLRWAIRGSG